MVKRKDAGIYCTRGTKAFFRTCFTIIFLEDIPLILASLI